MSLSNKSKSAAPLEVIKHEPLESPALTECYILRDFGYSHDGFTEQRAIAGEVVGIPTELVAGLEAEGYLSQGEPEPVPPPPVTKSRKR